MACRGVFALLDFLEDLLHRIQLAVELIEPR
jgi:hypothetical protein